MPHRTALVNGRRLTYVDIGRGPVLVFLHGAGVQARTYLPLIQQLARNYRVLAPDLPGFGQSAALPGTPSLENFALHLANWLRGLAIRDWKLIGHSFGGGVALAIGQREPSLRQIIVVSSLGAPVAHSLFQLVTRFVVYKTFNDVVVYGQPRLFATILYDFISSLFHQRSSMLRTMWAVVLAVKRPRIDLKSISADVTVLSSNADEIFPEGYRAKLLAALPRDATLILVKGNHDWPLVYPLEASQEILGAVQ